MSVWDEYFTEELKTKMFRICARHVNKQRSIFEDCFQSARLEFYEMCDEIQIEWSWGSGLPFITYRSRGSSRTVELKWWVARRIRAINRRLRPRGPQIDNADHFASAQASDLPNVSICTRVGEWISLLDYCLRTATSTNEKLAMFANMMFGGYQLRDENEISGSGVIDALPLECADEILERFSLNQTQVKDWLGKNSSTPAVIHRARFRARQKLARCLITQYGDRWQSVLIGSIVEGET